LQVALMPKARHRPQLPNATPTHVISQVQRRLRRLGFPLRVVLSDNGPSTPPSGSGTTSPTSA